MTSLSKSIFWIKYYATKHGCIIERKATLDNECYEGTHKKHGYPYKVYVISRLLKKKTTDKINIDVQVKSGK